jgi:plastocyanin
MVVATMTDALRRALRPAIALGIAVGVVVLVGLSVFFPAHGFVAPARVGAAEGDYVAVRALDDFFTSEVVRVPVGSVVEWAMAGRNPHTVTADDGAFDSGILQPGGEYQQTFAKAGVYRYFCTLHGAKGGKGMSGVVVVGDVPLPTETGQGAGPGREPVPTGPGKTIRVPADAPTIQAAVDAARPGDLVLVSPGVYHEAVRVFTPYLTIRGTDRNTVILDGEFKLPNGIHVIEADGVVVENISARHYQLNGFYWTGVFGYRGSYLSASANGDYGIYAFNSAYGRFEHAYASGSPDSGFYIGECQPCHAVVDDVLAEDNAIGFSGTNAGGDLAIVNSEWRDNLAGIVPNTLDSELLAPQHGALIAGNWVHGNNNLSAPAKPLTLPSYGNGIIVAGGRDNQIRGNRIEDQATYGIAVLPNLDQNLWVTSGNRIDGNDVERSSRADLALGAPSAGGDCFTDNQFRTSAPPVIESLNGCGSLLAPSFGEFGVSIGLLERFAEAAAGHVAHNDWHDQPDAPPEPSMPDAETAGVVLAVPESAVPGPYTVRPLSEITNPGRPDIPTGIKPVPVEGGYAVEVTLMAVPFAGTPFGLLIGFYGYIFPLILFATWVAVAIWDLVRRTDLASRRTLTWMAVVLAVPLVGPVLYFWFGSSPIPRNVRLMLVGGALLVYLVVAFLGILGA